MKSLRYPILFLAVVGVIALMAVQVQADWIYHTDFNDGTYTGGPIPPGYNPAPNTGPFVNGQNGWYDYAGTGKLSLFNDGPGNCGVQEHESANGTGANKGSGHYLYADQHSITFSAADTVELHMWAYDSATSGSDDYAEIGLSNGGARRPEAGSNGAPGATSASCHSSPLAAAPPSAIP